MFVHTHNEFDMCNHFDSRNYLNIILVKDLLRGVQGESGQVGKVKNSSCFILYTKTPITNTEFSTVSMIEWMVPKTILSK